MGNSRPRYNVKGRAASIAKLDEKLAGSKRKATEYNIDDSNAEIIDEVARKKQKAEVRSFDFASFFRISEQPLQVALGSWKPLEDVLGVALRPSEPLQSSQGR